MTLRLMALLMMLLVRSGLGAEELWQDDRITPEQPFPARVVAVQPGWGWDTIVLEEIKGDGRYCFATFGNPIGDYKVIRKEDFDAKAMKQEGAVFLDPPVKVERFSWSMGIWRHGRIFGDEDAATRFRKMKGEQVREGSARVSPRVESGSSKATQPD